MSSVSGPGSSPDDVEKIEGFEAKEKEEARDVDPKILDVAKKVIDQLEMIRTLAPKEFSSLQKKKVKHSPCFQPAGSSISRSNQC